jgi:hypothetical protein
MPLSGQQKGKRLKVEELTGRATYGTNGIFTIVDLLTTAGIVATLT